MLFRSESLRALLNDNDHKRDLDRQKTLWHSFMSEMRIRCVRIEEDIEDVRKLGLGL